MRRRSSVSIYITNQFAQLRQFETFNKRAALPDGVVEVKDADGWRIRGDSFNDLESVVAAAIEDHDKAEFAAILFLKIRDVLPEHRFDSALFIVRRYQ